MNFLREEWRDYVPDVTFELIAIKDLVSNQDYQRSISDRQIQLMVKNFDLHQINLVKVSRRNGANLVMNGQHTIETIAAKSGSRDTPVWCMVYNDLCYEHEADIFANQSKYTRALSSHEIFAAKIEAGYDEQIMIKTLVESYDLRICSNAHSDRIICAVSTLEKIYETYGFHILDETIRLILATWEGESASFAGNIMQGLARIIVCYGEALDRQVFAERLGHVSVKEVVRTARERNNGIIGYAETLLTYYNKKARTATLPWSRLYNIPKQDENMANDDSEKGTSPCIGQEISEDEGNQNSGYAPDSDYPAFAKEEQLVHDFPEAADIAE